MTLLSYLVPALREVRAPLVGGYLWLLAAWIAVGDRVPGAQDAEPDSIWWNLHRLGDEIGPAGLLVALSVAAYLVGALVGEVVDRALERLGAAAIGRRADAELEGVAAAQPEFRHAVDSAQRLNAEADLRTHSTVPLIGIAIIVSTRESWAGGALVGTLALALGIHGLVLQLRSARIAVSVIAAAEHRKEAMSIEERDQLRASPRIRKEKDRFILNNGGPTTAYDVHIKATDGSDLRFIPSGLLPVKELVPGDPVELPAAIAMGDPSDIEVSLNWVDGTGPSETTQYLRLY